MGAAQGRHEGASGPSHEERRGSHLFIEMEELQRHGVQKTLHLKPGAAKIEPRGKCCRSSSKWKATYYDSTHHIRIRRSPHPNPLLTFTRVVPSCQNVSRLTSSLSPRWCL